MSTMPLPPCGGQSERPPSKVRAKAFSVYAGSIPTTFPIPSPLARFTIPNMVQFLGENPNRVGLYIKANAAGVLIAPSAIGQGVAMTEVFGNDPTAGDRFELKMGFDQEAFLVSAWWAAIVNVAAYPADQMMLSGVEFYRE